MWNRLYPSAKNFAEAQKFHLNNKFNKPLVIVGPSGVGKSTLYQSFKEAYPDKV